MLEYTLGTIEASEKLIKDLYVDLRAKVNKWSEITQQTPQARMGYIGQHLVSVVTGYPGGKSGARGYDLVMEDGRYGEIKTCYRVDQLGACNNCGSAVSSLENKCPSCGSSDITRKDDSKWLISIRHDEEFLSLLNPERYYFVLFEFDDINNSDNNDIIASIWEVNPRNKGFAYCLIDYYLNIKTKSSSGAPFNMWPYQLKFLLTKPKLIYRSKIMGNGNLDTIIFPTLKNGYYEKLDDMRHYSSAKTLTADSVMRVINILSPELKITSTDKNELLGALQAVRVAKDISNDSLCDVLSDCIYTPLLDPIQDRVPHELLEKIR